MQKMVPPLHTGQYRYSTYPHKEGGKGSGLVVNLREGESEDHKAGSK